MEEYWRVRISVRNLVEFILRAGDIDNRRGAFGEKDAMQEGSRIHRRIQGQMGSGYQAEVPLSMEISWPEALFCCAEMPSHVRSADIPPEGRECPRPAIRDWGQNPARADRAADDAANDAANVRNALRLGDAAETLSQVRSDGAENGAGGKAKNAPAAEKFPAQKLVLTVEGRADGIFMEEKSRAKKGRKRLPTYDPCEFTLDSPADFSLVNVALKRGPDKISEEIPDGGTDQNSQKGIFYIDEIKGIYRDVMSLEYPLMLHLAQAKCYAYIYGSQKGLSHVGVQMTYCNLGMEDSDPDIREEDIPSSEKTAQAAALSGSETRDARQAGGGRRAGKKASYQSGIGQIRRFRQIYTMEELETWFMKLVGQYRKWAKLQIEWKVARQNSIRDLPFPFSWRPGQKDVASSVYRTIARGKKLFIQAPTGTGKTLSTIYPAVKAIGEGKADRLFYATAKTITRTVAEESFAILREKGLHMKTVTLTAKEKICFQEETECNPDACPYAKGHYDRVNDAVFELISENEALDRQALEAQARKWQVCPFEMGLDTALWTDAVICDYNYIFDPRARLKRFFGEGVKGDYLFLIDEAHNLVERGREMFSASLYMEEFLALRKEFLAFGRARKTDSSTQNECNAPILSRHHRPGELLRTARALARAAKHCIDWLQKRQLEMEERGAGVMTLGAWEDEAKSSFLSGASSQIMESTQGGIGVFPVYLLNLLGLMEDFMEDSLDAELNEKTLNLYFQIRSFLEVCDHLDDNYVVYTERLAKGRFLLRAYCVDISENLQECLDKGKSTIFFSATFLPINYYKSLLSTEKDNYAIYANPIFDPARRLVLIGADTSSRYRNRNEREYRKMAEYILEVMRARRGNYMVFFSSYQMMDDVADQLEWLCTEQGESVEVARQVSHMSEEEREVFLEKFEHPHPQGLAGFCVMGGIFGEGIDLREDRLIGAVIVGAGLPQVCSERELLKRFYDRRGEDGFFYAYLCPGMNRVLQSAGRVIRTEQDAGLILLLDERFAQARYRDMFPREWEHPDKCTLRTVREKAEAFWEQLSGDN
ncbi:MAG: ATP-dependent DNA helicase [Lachnospiraceae bacterium]|nr:ATP-dependent DNA helicase [Lachnospiraceae bacterium]